MSRSEIWSDLRHGCILGTEAFDAQLKPLLDERYAEREIPRMERQAARLTLDALFADVRDRGTWSERIHQAVRRHEYTLNEVSTYVGLHYSTISMIAKQLEESGKTQKMKV